MAMPRKQIHRQAPDLQGFQGGEANEYFNNTENMDKMLSKKRYAPVIPF
jgi:hypothetical protein